MELWQKLGSILYCSQYVLMYSPDDTNVYGTRGGEFEGIRVDVGDESCKIVFLGALPIHLFRHLL